MISFLHKLVFFLTLSYMAFSAIFSTYIFASYENVTNMLRIIPQYRFSQKVQNELQQLKPLLTSLVFMDKF